MEIIKKIKDKWLKQKFWPNCISFIFQLFLFILILLLLKLIKMDNIWTFYINWFSYIFNKILIEKQELYGDNIWQKICFALLITALPIIFLNEMGIPFEIIPYLFLIFYALKITIIVFLLKRRYENHLKQKYLIYTKDKMLVLQNVFLRNDMESYAKFLRRSIIRNIKNNELGIINIWHVMQKYRFHNPWPLGEPINWNNEFYNILRNQIENSIDGIKIIIPHRDLNKEGYERFRIEGRVFLTKNK